MTSTDAMQSRPAPTDAADSTLTIIGIDPGLQCTGFALLRGESPQPPRLLEAGVIRLNPSDAMELRLLELDRGLAKLIDQHAPSHLACEQLYAHYKHPRTAILMGHARGVILAAAARREVRIIDIPSTHAKKMLTGSGRASKSQMQRAVAATLGLAALPEPHDVADAIAIGLCGLQARLTQLRSAAGGAPA